MLLVRIINWCTYYNEGDVDGSDDGSFNYDDNDDVDKKHINLVST